MSEVLIFSDLHCHPHKRSVDRLNDCLKVLDWVFDTAKKRKISNILFLGDLFHDRQKIDVYTYQKTFEIFEKHLDGDVQIYLLLGNHDLWHLQKWDISSVNPFRQLPGVHVIDKPCTELIDDEYLVSFLPYTHDPIKDLQGIKNNSKFKMLCGHVAIDGAVWNATYGTFAEVSIEHDGDMVKVGPEIFKDWDRVFLGHYHAEQRLGTNTEYVGSPLQLSFGEAFQHKHIVVFNLETHEKEYIRNEFSPKHFIVKEKDLEKYDLNNNFVQVVVDNLAKSDIIEMRQDLVNQFKFGSLEIKQAKIQVEETKTIQDAKSFLNKENEMLETFLEKMEQTNGLGGLDKDILLKIGKEICGF